MTRVTHAVEIDLRFGGAPRKLLDFRACTRIGDLTRQIFDFRGQ
jgi:hypothetical protein